MARLVKCQFCDGVKKPNDQMFAVPVEGKKNNFKYYCNQEEYELTLARIKRKEEEQELKRIKKEEAEKLKKIESQQREQVIAFIMTEIINYDPDIMIFPKPVQTLVSELKEKHDFPTILEVFKKNQQSLAYAVRTKNLTKHSYGMAQYFKAVVEGDLNEIAKNKIVKEEAERRIKQMESTIINDSALESFENSQKKEFKNVKKTSGFLDFLGDDII